MTDLNKTETPEEKEALDRLSTEDFIVVGNPEKFSEFKAKWEGFDTTNAQFESLAVEVNSKSPRIKEVYEKVKFDSVIDIIRYLDTGKWLYTNKNGNAHIDRRVVGQWKVEDLEKKEFYHWVEKEIDWRDEVKSYIESVKYLSKNDKIESVYNGDEAEDDEAWEFEFIGMCHLVASLTDKPE